MYYFYLIESLSGRVGFGIAQDIKDRNKDYCSHCGEIVNMVVYGGLRAHSKSLERSIKSELIEHRWIVADWKTEWLDKPCTLNFLKGYVDSLIKERHLKVQLITTEYNFSMDIEDFIDNN
jgi:hypothetical protein